MFFRSLLWERTVLSLLEKVEELPPNVQAEIAKHVGDHIEIASAAHEADSMKRLAAAAVEQREQAAAEGINSALDQRCAVPAFVEAWCVAKLALYDGSLSRQSAMAVLAAIEAFALERPTCLAPKVR